MKNIYFYQQKRTLLALAITASFGVNAQENSAQSTSIEEKAKDDIEVIVVAGEFQQSLVNRIPVTTQELPFTLDVIDGDFLNDRNFARPIEALTTLPNIFRTEDRQGTGGTQFLSRGFDAPILVDNRVQNNFRGAGSRDSSFVERYEVLKGPASIASGPVGGGGIINTVTKSPHQERAANVKVRADHFGSAGVDFDTNIGEIDNSDAFLFRVSGAYRDFKFDADTVGRETIAIRPVATFNIGSATSAKASIAYTEHTVTPTSGFPLLQNGDIPDGIDTDTFAGYENSEGEVKDNLANLEVTHNFLDNLKLTLRGSKQKTDFDYQNTSGLYNYSRDDSGLEATYAFPQTAETESEATFADAQLAYTTQLWGHDQNIAIGIAHDERSFERLFNTYAYDGPFSLADIDQPRFGSGGTGEPEPFTLTDSTLKSVFAEAALRPSERLTILAGIRYDDLVQDTTNFRRGNAFLSEFDDSELTIRLGASFETSDTINVYASYAQAFVPQFGVRRDNGAVAAETSESYELGAKGSAFNDVISFQAGIFHTLRKDVALQDPTNTATEAFVVSAGELEVQGIEFSSHIYPIDALSIAFNVGYTNVDVTQAGDDEISAPVFPELTSSLYVDYAIDSGAFEGLSIGGGVRYVGEQEGPLVDWNSYAVIDFNLGYQINDSVELSFDILNVADKKYVENTSTPVVNRLTGGAVLGAPLTAVLTLNWTL